MLTSFDVWFIGAVVTFVCLNARPTGRCCSVSIRDTLGFGVRLTRLGIASDLGDAAPQWLFATE